MRLHALPETVHGAEMPLQINAATEDLLAMTASISEGEERHDQLALDDRSSMATHVFLRTAGRLAGSEAFDAEGGPSSLYPTHEPVSSVSTAIPHATSALAIASSARGGGVRGLAMSMVVKRVAEEQGVLSKSEGRSEDKVRCSKAQRLSSCAFLAQIGELGPAPVPSVFESASGSVPSSSHQLARRSS